LRLSRWGLPLRATRSPSDDLFGTRMTTDLFRLTAEGPVKVLELSLPTSIDSSEFDRLNESVLEALRDEPGAGWVLDLSAVAYMGSAVLGLMVNIRQVVRQAQGTLVLCGMSDRLMRIFETCCMERLFKIVPGRPEALRFASRR
jgi:anti-sigma B factor antagonist